MSPPSCVQATSLQNLRLLDLTQLMTDFVWLIWTRNFAVLKDYFLLPRICLSDNLRLGVVTNRLRMVI